MLDSKPLLLPGDFPSIKRQKLETLQVNLGYLCNQQCLHCHVNAGPSRTEMMTDEVVDQLLDLLSEMDIKVLDLTGGAPEMHPRFVEILAFASQQGVQVIDRCNLTILQEPGFELIASSLAKYNVRVVASLPCYLEENVDTQRGKGTFVASIEGLKQLNQLGYGQPESALQLDLVFNPQGAELPPPQLQLELDYKKYLQEKFNVQFNQLLTLANLPISRFGSMLQSKGLFHDYLSLLKSSHSVQNLQNVMCRSLVSIGWQGQVYDCDFNQMLDMPLRLDGKLLMLADLKSSDLTGNSILTGMHCYGCTAGQGSSCGGALSA